MLYSPLFYYTIFIALYSVLYLMSCSCYCYRSTDRGTGCSLTPLQIFDPLMCFILSAGGNLNSLFCQTLSCHFTSAVPVHQHLFSVTLHSNAGSLGNNIIVYVTYITVGIPHILTHPVFLSVQFAVIGRTSSCKYIRYHSRKPAAQLLFHDVVVYCFYLLLLPIKHYGAQLFLHDQKGIYVKCSLCSKDTKYSLSSI